MKNTTLTILTILVLALTACGAAANGSELASIPQSSTNAELPAITQLIIGTLKLEATDQAVTAEQANELLPLWQTLQVLSESDTTAVQETEALITQIQETMTPEQMQAIADMNLTRDDMFAIMQEQGLTIGAGSQSNSQGGNSTGNGGGGFGPGGGIAGPPNGEFPAGGPGFGGQGQNLSPDQIATAQAARQQRSGDFVPPMLINTLLDYLQEKVDS